MMYLVSFGIEGYESMVEIDQYRDDSEKYLFEKLKNPNIPKPSDTLGQILESLELRFRFNTHRRIETYTIHLDDTLAKLVGDKLSDNDESVKKFIRAHGEEFPI